MAERRSIFSELGRRNVLRGGVLYVGAVWALSQGIAQLTPALGLPDHATRWFLIASVIGFPFWVAFAWFYEFTPHGFRRDSEVARDAPVRHSNARRLDFAIIGVLAAAVALLASGYFFRHAAPAPDAAAAAAAAIPAKSIAVLPFQNLSNDQDNAYFVAGMQDLILTKLADIEDLKVISRTSTAKYASHPDDLRIIGAQLGVANILEGSVQKHGDQVLINVQLIDTRTNGHLWAQSYQRTLNNVFGVEGDVAEKIAAALETRLSPAETTRLASHMSANHAANNLFLRAEFHIDQGGTNYDTADMKTALELYRQALALDPQFALAYARLSRAESSLAWFGGGGMDVKALTVDARGNAEQALRLAPELPAAHLALGYSQYYGRSDYTAALKAFTAALALRPNDPDTLAAQGFIERRQGRFDAAIASLQRAFELDPRNSSLAYEVGNTEMMSGRYPDAERWFQRALALDPRNLNAKTNLALTIVYATGDIPRALIVLQGDDAALKLKRVGLLTLQREYREALALLESVPDTPDNFTSNGASKALWQAELYRMMGNSASARPLYTQALSLIGKQIDQQQGINQAFAWHHLAAAELGLGNVAQGLDAIARARAIGVGSNDHLYGQQLTESSAMLYAEARRPDLAVPLLAEALAGSRYPPLMLWIEPAWDPIREDSAFQALLKQYVKYKPAVTYTAPAANATRTPLPSGEGQG